MIYFDSAATTFQKPPTVRKAVLHAMQTMSSPGRGSYPHAEAAEEMLFHCRSLASELFGLSSPEQVALTAACWRGRCLKRSRSRSSLR